MALASPAYSNSSGLPASNDGKAFRISVKCFRIAISALVRLAPIDASKDRPMLVNERHHRLRAVERQMTNTVHM